MPTPANEGKETQGEDNNALQLIELRRQLQEEEIGRLRQQLYHLQTTPLTTRQVQVEAPTVTTVTTPAVAPAASSLASTPKVKLDKYEGKTLIVQWWLKFMTFLSLQKVLKKKKSEAVAINTFLLPRRSS